MEKRYIKNLGTLTEEEQVVLFDSKVCVVGCGGLGGYIIEILARLGVGHITAVDGDVFDETNLNRQLFSEPALMGVKKALAAEARVNRVNPDVKLLPVTEFFDEQNGEEILNGHDLVIDALDNVDSRLLLNDLCRKLNMVMIHGAIGNWFGQISVIRPEDNIMEALYESELDLKKIGNPAFIPSVIAAMEVSECVKVLLNKGSTLAGKVLTVDLLENEFEITEF